MADTEGIAVAAVRAAIAGADYLKGYISDNDKGPSLDGYICGYTKKGYKKDFESGRAQVQIKGKESKASDLLKENISYPVEVADLKVFKQLHGAIFFVVLFEKGHTDHKRIYYNPLLPYDINNLLKDKEQQKTVTIYLKPFPTGKEMEDTVLTFIDNGKKQSPLISLDGNKNFSLKDVFKSHLLNAPISFNVGYTSIQKQKPENNFQYFFTHDFYVYFKNEFGISIPMQHVDRLKMVNRIYPCSLCVGDTEYFDKCKITKLKDKTIYGFFSTKTLGYEERRKLEPDLSTNVVVQEAVSNGKAAVKPKKKVQPANDEPFNVKRFPFTIEMTDDEPDELGRHKASYTYNITGNLSERINIGSFILELFDKKKYILNGHESPFNPPEDKIKGFDFDGLREELKHWKDVTEALDLVGCNEPLALDGFTDEDEKRLNIFVASVLHHQPLKYNNPIPRFVLYQIHNLQLLIFYERQADGQYLLKKIPDEETQFEIEIARGEIDPTSFYCKFTAENFAAISNLDFEQITGSIMAYENGPHLEQANMTLLRMLIAYDETGKEELLDSALKIATWLVEKKVPDITVVLMNFYQCMKRKGLFKTSEANSVRELMKNQTKPDILAGCYLLLDDSEKAAEQIKLLDKDSQKAFLDYPIMKFMDEDVKNKEFAGTSNSTE